MKFKILIVIIVILITYVYVSYYYRYPKTVSILQTRLEDFSLQALLEKQPIVIQDLVKDMSELQNAWFKSNIIYNDVYESDHNDTWRKNRFKYLFLKPEHEDTEVLLYPAHLKMIDSNPDPDESILAIKLKKDQVIVIPIHWHYCISSLNSTLYTSFGVHDYITFVLP